MRRPGLAAGVVVALLASGHAAAEPPRLEVQEVAATGSMPKGAILSRDGKRVYVTNFGQEGRGNVTVLDGETLAAVGVVDAPGVVVEGVLSPDDKTLFVSNFRRSSVLFVDTETLRVTREVKTGANPKVVAITPDGRSLFSANWSARSVTRIDVASGAAVQTLEVGRMPRGMAISSKGALFVANFYGDSIDVFEAPAYDKRRRLAVCKCPRHLALSPDDKILYVSCLHASELHALDPQTGAVLHKVTLGRAPKTVAVSRDGRWVWSADYGTTRSVSVVDTRDWTARVFPVPGMDRGSGVAVAPDGRHAFVTGWYDGHVYRVGFEGAGGHPAEARRRIQGWIHRPPHPDPGDGS